MIAHLDIDAFFAAVELHRHPELRGRPVVVGGDPGGRGVVATASYAAREFGIRSAMSCAEARRRCPHVVFLPPDMAHYREWSTRFWEEVRGLAAEVEQVGFDEGYLALDDDAVAHAHRIRAAVRERLRLSCSLGVATCKVVAKIASDHDKPGGITVVSPGEEARFLAPLPMRALPGVGPRTDARLAAAGLRTIGDIAALDDDALIGGRFGADLRRRARGIDSRAVRSEPAERVSISTERTFAADIADRAELEIMGRQMSERIAGTLRSRGRVARTVTVKLRYPDFSTITRAHTLAGAIDEATAIWDHARRLLGAALADRDEPLRLLGVGVTGLGDERQLRLFTGADPRDEPLAG